MPRLSRKDLISEVFHIMIQGINKEYIFEYNENKEKFIKIFKHKIKEFHIISISYCVMDNHVHMLLYAPDINEVSKFMHRINTTYAKWYNWKNERVGYVFRDRYKCEQILDLHHFFSCIQYIHNNPVRAEIVEKPEEYQYSSYLDYVSNKVIFNMELLNSLNISKEGFRDIVIDSKKVYVDGFAKLDPQIIIKNYLKDINYKGKKHGLDKENLKRLATLLKEDCKIGYKEIADKLGISRSSLYRLLK